MARCNDSAFKGSLMRETIASDNLLRPRHFGPSVFGESLANCCLLQVFWFLLRVLHTSLFNVKYVKNNSLVIW
jgi:hypothetical protein